MTNTLNQIMDDLVEEIAKQTFIFKAGDPKGLKQFEEFACNRIANMERVTPDRIKLLNLRWEDTKIVFNGYRILPKSTTVKI